MRCVSSYFEYCWNNSYGNIHNTMKVELYTIVGVYRMILGISYFFISPRMFPHSPFFMLYYPQVSAEVFKFIFYNETKVK